MTSAEIKTILEEHSKWLEDNKNGKYANLRGANLRNEDLRDADLRNADLGEADLRGADLRGGRLRGGKPQGDRFILSYSLSRRRLIHCVEKSRELYYKA